ncbi:hypothetical protein [Chryseobacterium sp. G0240]|nr:hypothetical protein [Chryseobacterium sp. G0240]
MKAKEAFTDLQQEFAFNGIEAKINQKENLVRIGNRNPSGGGQ